MEYTIEEENKGFQKRFNCRLTQEQHESLMNLSNDLQIGSSRLIRRMINVMNSMKLHQIRE